MKCLLKKTLLLSLLFLLAAPHALAAGSGFTALAPIPGLTDISPTSLANPANLADFFSNLYKYLIGVAAILAIIMIIWGGVEIATQDSVSKKTDGKKKIYDALYGLVLVLAPAIVFSIINPSILNLSLSLERLNIPTSTTTPAGLNGPITTQSVTGCTVSGTYFQQATCPTLQARQQWTAMCTNGRTTVAGCRTVNPSDRSCADATFQATCDTDSGPLTGPFVFLVRRATDWQPVASTQGNPNNGTMVIQFANRCQADGGVVCLIAPSPSIIGRLIGGASYESPVTCPPLSMQPSSQVNRCYNKNIVCRNPSNYNSGVGTICRPSLQIIQ